VVGRWWYDGNSLLGDNIRWLLLVREAGSNQIDSGWFYGLGATHWDPFKPVQHVLESTRLVLEASDPAPSTYGVEPIHHFFSGKTIRQKPLPRGGIKIGAS
jgi:hypothetical protein